MLEARDCHSCDLCDLAKVQRFELQGVGDAYENCTSAASAVGLWEESEGPTSKTWSVVSTYLKNMSQWVQ